ncbi:MAG: hypothetical protein Q8S11_13625 [Daejeonella sp.]|nr:hypothetical protein [Daejeonella sp.]
MTSNFRRQDLKHQLWYDGSRTTIIPLNTLFIQDFRGFFMVVGQNA